MSQFNIAWLPGDGVGVEVMEAAKICLDALKFDAKYTHGDIGWEFWRTEGESFPQRTIDLLKNSHAAMFGAITSKPVKDAEAELVPELQGKGLVYRSPIVRMRQMFDLYTCLRPCKAYPGNPLNYQDGIDMVVFRENTEDLYSGVEFSPVPDELKATLKHLSKPFGHFADLPGDAFAITCKVNTKKGCDRIIRAAFEYAKTFNYPKVTVIHKANVVRATEGMFLETGKRIAKEYPGIAMDDANVDAITMWMLKNPKNYGVMVATNLFGEEDPVGQTIKVSVQGRPGVNFRVVGQLQSKGGTGFGSQDDQIIIPTEPWPGAAPVVQRRPRCRARRSSCRGSSPC